MDTSELIGVFDRMAPGYDEKQARMASVYDALYSCIEDVLADLPPHARILCVGAGTGTELIRLAEAHPDWHFTAVEPSAAMLDVCTARVLEAGIDQRCELHHGFLESLPPRPPYDAATCLLVSQFILDPSARAAFFGEIAERLVPGGIIVDADLSADVSSPGYDELIALWHRMTTASAGSAEDLERMKSGYAKDVAILPSEAVADLIASAGFEQPTPFFQAGLIRAWFARRSDPE